MRKKAFGFLRPASFTFLIFIFLILTFGSKSNTLLTKEISENFES